jgi:hypothetical protein
MCMSRLRLRVVSANRRPSLATARRECGLLWQPRFFGRALRTLQGYGEKVTFLETLTLARFLGQLFRRIRVPKN